MQLTTKAIAVQPVIVILIPVRIAQSIQGGMSNREPTKASTQYNIIGIAHRIQHKVGKNAILLAAPVVVYILPAISYISHKQ